MKVSASRFPVVLFSRCLVCTVTVTLLVVQTVPAQVVNIPDSNLRQLVTETLQLPDGTPITQQEMLRLEFLDAAGDRGITDLTGLQYATNLWGLDLYHNPIVNISSLAHLTKLEGFNLWGCQVVDLSPLRNLTGLRTVILGNNHISDITPLANLVQLTNLGLDNNQISDVSPLANLILLEELRLNANAITDVTPLAGLTNLKKLYLAGNPIHNFRPLAELEEIELDLEIDLSRLDELNVVVGVPDPNLEQAIRESLSLPKPMPLTQVLMLGLTELETGERGIIDLTGIEYATNLHYLNLGGNQIRDIRPLAVLISLTGLSLYNNPVEDIAPLANLTKLTYLNLAHNGIETLEPLAGLIHLQTLDLFDNRIKDITPLANLTALTTLILTHNRVSDFSPLANLANLEELWINDNFGTDISPLARLNLTDFRYDEVCDIAPPLPSVRTRIKNRTFPSVFAAWGGVGWSPVENRTDLSDEEQVTLHDLHWSPFFILDWNTSPTESTYGVATSFAGDLARAREDRQWRLDRNSNMVFLVEVRLHNHFTPEAFPPDSDFWLRDAQGQIIRNSADQYLINFLKPKVQDLLAKRIIAVARCGLYDGVLLDGAGANGGNRFVGRRFHTATNAEITQAMRNILGTVRANTRDDFLIVVNSNDNIVEGYPELVNGNFMETFKDHPGGYSQHLLKRLEYVLSWSEENLREPRVNCLEAQGMSIEPPDGPNNLRMMRAITTLSLTHSDGYVLYTDGVRDLGELSYPHHHHWWHLFWDANLGRPIGPKAQPYQNIAGLFIREFTNGWAVYNRSGQAQTIALPASAIPVSDRGNNSASQTHILPDLDGEIYLKDRNPADVNGDWVVNILDLVQVANGFGKSAPDPNGDGQVNILDLVFVAQQFSQ